MKWHSMPAAKRKRVWFSTEQIGCSAVGQAVFAIFGLCAGVLVCGAAVFMVGYDHLLDVNGIVTRAVVADLWYSSAPKGDGQNLNLFYRYSVNDQTYSNQYQISTAFVDANAFAKGDSFLIRYLPDNPGMSRVDEPALAPPAQRLLIYVILVTVGAFATLIALNGLRRSIKRQLNPAGESPPITS
jgi:hypothetical protein